MFIRTITTKVLAVATGSLLIFLEGVYATPTPSGQPSRRQQGTFVSDITQCPTLKARTATSVHDLRPDDFSVTLAVGDSITAGAFAKGIQTNPLLDLAEWRGVSYAGGGDPGAITVPNLIKHYNSSAVGASTGRNDIPELCFGPLCPIGGLGWNSNVDNLNAAQSGALASNLLHEVRDYLIPQVKARKISDKSFKYLNLQIGSNDICQLCLAASLRYGPGSADDFEKNIRETLEYIRLNLPNVVVNVLSVFKVSEIYQLTLNQPYCSQLVPFPHANIECSCALLGGDIGAFTRSQMDSLQSQYNQRLIDIVKSYQTARYPTFAVVWQPVNVPLSTYPIEALSNVDCFHPSVLAHQRFAVGVWNGLTSPDNAEKAAAWPWANTLSFRCLEEADRIPTNAALSL